MSPRTEALGDARAGVGVRLAAALRASLSGGYGRAEFKRDLLAGITVGIVALPLSMALAIASGVPPQHGIYTAIFAGGLAALLGGSRVQITGPTNTFVLLAPIAAQFGLAGLLVATMLAGALQICMGLARFGRMIQFIPSTVTVGFTAGIALVIAVVQVKDFFGLDMATSPSRVLEKVVALAKAMPTMQWQELLVGSVTLLTLIFWKKVTTRIPSPLVAMLVAGLLGYLLEAHAGLSIATISDRYDIPQSIPLPHLPWDYHGPDEKTIPMDLAFLQALIPSAFVLAILGSMESLLSAVVADGITGHKHDSDAELVGQGVGNLIAPFFGGFAGSGAIARTAANIGFGAVSPISALIHVVFLVVTLLLLAPVLGMLPMAAMAALLLRVAWVMTDLRHILYLLRVAPRSDVLVMLSCFGLTVIFDLITAVEVGVVMAALIFTRRMADVSDVRLVHEEIYEHDETPLPKEVLHYEIAGPMFFGAAEKAMAALRYMRDGVRVVVFDMRAVPVMDVTGLINLQSALDKLGRMGVLVILASVQKQPLRVMAKAKLRKDRHYLSVCSTLKQALDTARAMAVLMPEEPKVESGKPVPGLP